MTLTTVCMLARLLTLVIFGAGLKKPPMSDVIRKLLKGCQAKRQKDADTTTSEKPTTTVGDLAKDKVGYVIEVLPPSKRKNTPIKAHT